MKIRRPSGLLLPVLAVIVLALMPTLALTQAYPTKPIRIVVGFAAGGSNDFIARIVGDKLGAALGQTAFVDNRPGVGGNIATELVAKAPADGHTLLVIASSLVINPSLYSKVNYDPIKDFEPVSILTTYSLFLVVHPSLPARSVSALIALAKQKPGALNYASGGSGTTGHLAAELFSHMGGVQMTHIPYKGAGPAIPAVMSGDVQMIYATLASVLPHIKSGKLRAMGVTSAKRSPSLPDVPTIAEAGLPGYEATSWNALFAPAGTPIAIVKRISEGIGKGLKQPDALEIFEKQGIDEVTGTPEALATLVRTEFIKWSNVIKTANIKLE